MGTRLLGIAIFMMLHLAGQAAELKIADFEKVCVEVKKKAALCRCLSSNIERKINNSEMDHAQILVAIHALKGQPPPEDGNSTAYDNVADFLAGLEPRCLKNSKFSGE